MECTNEAFLGRCGPFCPRQRGPNGCSGRAVEGGQSEPGVHQTAVHVHQSSFHVPFWHGTSPHMPEHVVYQVRRYEPLHSVSPSCHMSLALVACLP